MDPAQSAAVSHTSEQVLTPVGQSSDSQVDEVEHEAPMGEPPVCSRRQKATTVLPEGFCTSLQTSPAGHCEVAVQGLTTHSGKLAVKPPTVTGSISHDPPTEQSDADWQGALQ
jgi:hypothetical protein